MRVEKEFNLPYLRGYLNQKIKRRKVWVIFPVKYFVEKFKRHPLANIDRQIVNELSASLNLDVCLYADRSGNNLQFDLRSNLYNKKLLRKGG